MGRYIHTGGQNGFTPVHLLIGGRRLIMNGEKRYLNKAEKDTMFFMAGFTNALEEVIESLIKYGDKEKAKWAKTARTYAQKIMEGYMTPLDTQQKAKVIVDSAKYRAFVTYHNDAKDDLKKSLSLEENIPVNKEDFLDIIERAVYWCCECKKRGNRVEQCNLRKLFIKYDVEVFDQTAPVSICPYRNPGKEELATG